MLLQARHNGLSNYFLAPIGKALNEMLVIHALRPDRLLASAHLLVNSAFGNEFMQQDKVLNLREIVEEEVCFLIEVCLIFLYRFRAVLHYYSVRRLVSTHQIKSKTSLSSCVVKLLRLPSVLQKALLKRIQL